MNTIKQLIQESLEDEKLISSERNAITHAIQAANLNTEAFSQLRNYVFQLAKEQLAEDNAYALIKWLERIVKTIDNAKPQYASAEAFFSPGKDCLSQIKHLINTAQQSLDICVFTVTDNRIGEQIIAAHQRGVKLRVISDNDKALDKGSDIYTFHEHRIPVRLDKTRNHMHHKFAIIDGKTVINGSFNWTRSATDFNHENIVVHSDALLIARFQHRFEQLWDAFG